MENLPLSEFLIYTNLATALIAVSVDSFDEKELLPVLNGWQVGQSHSSKGGHSQQVTNLENFFTYSALHIFHLLRTEIRLMHIPQHLHTYRVTTAVSHGSVALYTCQQNCFLLNISDMTLPKHQSHYTLQHQ